MEYGKFVTNSLVSTGKIECRSLEKGFHEFKAICLLYLSVSTAAVIGQFGGPYSTARPAKILKAVFVAKMFRDL